MGIESDEMIEIGDPAIEPTVPEPTHQVVIQYRDRGVPWMLLPALLMLSAIATIYAYRKLQPPPPPHRPTPTVSVALPVEPEVAKVVEPTPIVPAVEPAPTPVVPPVEPTPPPVEPAPAPVEPAPMTSPDEPKPVPRVQGLGFDPNAFLPDPRATDSAVNAASQEPARTDPAPAQVVDPNTLPVEVDPDDLPPDPRKAREIRGRRALEARKRAESDRVKFHTDLRAILRNPEGPVGPAITELCDQYGDDVDPSVKSAAAKQLNFAYAGASRPVRINLLRNLGFPEAAILRDLYHNATKDETPNSRSSWKSPDHAIVYVSRILLDNPPARPATASATAPKPKAAAGARPPGSLLLRDNPGR